MFSQQQANMEVTSLCITQLINLLVLLPAQVQHSYSHKADATFPRIVPSRLQFFEYESVSVKCEGFFNDLIEWRVMRKTKETTARCKNQLEITGTCNIETAYSADSGEYWCEADGKKSNAVNIIVTAASVILESPALPVAEGEAVSLRCREKTSSNSAADFYKDGLLIENSTTGNMTIHSVSKSDEGLYKCSISGPGESAESWLAVRANQEETPYHRSPRIFFLLCLVVAFLLVSLLLLLVVGLHHMKVKGASTAPPPLSASSPPLQTVSAEASVGEPQSATYAVVTKHTKKEKDEEESCTNPVYSTLSTGPGAPSSAATPVPSESANQFLTEEDCFYCTIDLK